MQKRYLRATHSIREEQISSYTRRELLVMQNTNTRARILIIKYYNNKSRNINSRLILFPVRAWFVIKISVRFRESEQRADERSVKWARPREE